jgi:hypothetical protein
VTVILSDLTSVVQGAEHCTPADLKRLVNGAKTADAWAEHNNRLTGAFAECLRSAVGKRKEMEALYATVRQSQERRSDRPAWFDVQDGWSAGVPLLRHPGFYQRSIARASGGIGPKIDIEQKSRPFVAPVSWHGRKRFRQVHFQIATRLSHRLHSVQRFDLQQRTDVCQRLPACGQ